MCTLRTEEVPRGKFSPKATSGKLCVPGTKVPNATPKMLSLKHSYMLSPKHSLLNVIGETFEIKYIPLICFLQFLLIIIHRKFEFL